MQSLYERTITLPLKQRFILAIVGFLFIMLFTVSFEIPFGIYILLLLAWIVIVLFIPLFYTLLFSKDVDQIERFLYNNQKQAVYRFFYKLSHDKQEEAYNALQQHLKKVRSRSKQATFKMMYAAHTKDKEMLEQELPHVQKPSLKAYYEGVVSLLNGDEEEVKQKADQLDTPHLKEMLYASIAVRNEDIESVKTHNERAIELTRGLQRYSLTKKYEQEIKKLQQKR